MPDAGSCLPVSADAVMLAPGSCLDARYVFADAVTPFCFSQSLRLLLPAGCFPARALNRKNESRPKPAEPVSSYPVLGLT